MISFTRNLPFALISRSTSKKPARTPALEISPPLRAFIALAASIMTSLAFLATGRMLLGFTPEIAQVRTLAVGIHIATVLPTIPLGGFLLLAPKGTPMHKQLGKLWVALMVITASAAFFIRTGGNFSFIHIFVPLTMIASYKLIAKARRGDIKGHRNEILALYLGALMIPGLVAIAMPGRLMNMWLFG